jgi:HAD superfamily hydrolase (TIGR01509 family)
MNEKEALKAWRCRAVIFDFNGVIVDDEPLHAELMQQVLADEDITLPATLFPQLALGVTDRAGFAALLQVAGRTPDERLIQQLITRKTAAYQQAIAARDLFFPGVIELIEQLAQRVPLAIVSGALRSEIEPTLRRGNVQHCFKAIITGEDVQASKPDPEGFLKALTAFENVQAQDCLVIEDSVAGVRAAKRAGMKCLAVTTSYPAEKLIEANWVLPNLAQPLECCGDNAAFRS